MVLKIPGFKSLFGTARTGNETTIRETIIEKEFFKGTILTTEIPGAPQETYEEGTLVLNMADNRLYCSVNGAIEQPLNHWKLNETTGTTASDVGSSGRNLTVDNTLGWTNGYYEGGYNTTSYGGSLASNSDYDWGNKTFEFWAKRTASMTSVGNLLMGRKSGDHQWIFGGLPAGGDIKWGCYLQDAGGFEYLQTALGVNDLFNLDQWHHCAMVFDVTNSIFTAYIDGEIVLSSAITISPVVSGVTMYIMKDRAVPAVQWKGIIDDWKIWTSVRSQAQIKNDSLKSGGLVWTYTPLTGA